MRRILVSMLTALVAGGAATAAADVAPQRNWQQIHSPHFRLAGDVPVRSLRQVAGRLEQLHELLSILTGSGDGLPLDTTVLVFKDRNAYRPFTPLYNGAPKDVAGYFQPGDTNYITLLMTQEEEGQSVVLHEYVHLFIDRIYGEVAPWIGEGLAEYYSTFDVIDGGRTARLGRMLQHHLWTMQREQLPLETLAAVTHDSPYYNENAKTTVFYAQSWGLVHYLQNGKRRAYGPKFGPFVDAVREGTPFADACLQVLGISAEALGKELVNYANSPILMSLNVRLPTRLAAIERLEPTPLPEAEAHALLGHLLSLQADRKEAQAELERAVQLQPTQPLALATLARMAAVAGRLTDARTFGTKPADAPTFLSEYLRASALDVVARDKDGAANEALAPVIEQALRASLALHPSFAPAHALLSQRLGEDEETRVEARGLIQKAIILAPIREDFRLQLARLSLLDGDVPAARKILGPMAARGSTPELKAAARQYLAQSARISEVLERNAELAASDAARREAEEAARAAGAAGTLTAATPPEPEPEPEPEPAEPPAAGRPPLRAGRDFDFRRAPGPGNGATPVLRLGLPGETRVFGTLTAIECPASGVVVVAAVDGAPLRVSATAIGRIEWISYRGGAPGTVSCGAQTPGPVLVTYRPRRTGASGSSATNGTAGGANGIAGVAVAVELMPPGYKP